MSSPMLTMFTNSAWSRPRAALALMLMTRPAAGARVVACRPAYLSPLAWLALQAAALWPHGVWLVRRVQDGSDDPLGLAAIAVMVLLLWRRAAPWRVAPQLGWLAAAAALTTLAALGLFIAPPLLAALIAALALAAGLVAWLPAQTPRLPFAGLALLALPLVSSLQYYGGYPLRLLTAQLSSWALQLAGLSAERSGASMWVNGQLVIVDAPCSGVQMVWMAYFCACSVAALVSLPDAAFLRRLPFIGGLVLLGNVLRNSVLVALESRPQGLDAGVHQAIGVVALAAVCGAVLLLMRFEDKPFGRTLRVASGQTRPFGLSLSKPRSMTARLRQAQPEREPQPERGFQPERGSQGERGRSVRTGRGNALRGEPLFQKHWPAAMGVVLALCALLPLTLPARDLHAAAPTHTEWPREWEGHALRPLATNAVEQRFAARFPGAIARFTDGERVLVLRRVNQPTRMLHPAADCFRGLGYRIEQARLERDAQARLWRCFEASLEAGKGRRITGASTGASTGADGERLRVCERIEAADGSAFTDPSAWFWAASLGQSSGPWQAVTVVEAL